MMECTRYCDGRQGLREVVCWCPECGKHAVYSYEPLVCPSCGCGFTLPKEVVNWQAECWGE